VRPSTGFQWFPAVAATFGLILSNPAGINSLIFLPFPAVSELLEAVNFHQIPMGVTLADLVDSFALWELGRS
jgi:hypothetical protein